MRTPSRKHLSYAQVVAIVSLWPEYKGTVSSRRAIKFESARPATNADCEFKYGFWAEARKFRSGWRFKAEKGEIYWWGKRSQTNPEDGTASLDIMLSDFTVRLQQLTGPMQQLEVLSV